MTGEKSQRFEPDTRRPDPAPPSGACDCQFHVFAPEGEFPPMADMYAPPESNLADALAMHAKLGVTRGVMVQPTIYLIDHRLLLKSLAATPGYRGVAIIDDSVGDAELLRLHEAGVRGARFNFAKHLGLSFDRKQFDRTIARVAALGWHAKIHGEFGDLLDFAEMFRSLRLPAVIDHFGRVDVSLGVVQPGVGLILELLARENWWLLLANADRFSVTGPPWDDTVAIARTYVDAAPARILWATDFPHIRYKRTMVNDGDLVELLYAQVPDEAQRRAILVDNPARLYFGE